MISPLPAAPEPTESKVGGHREEWTGLPSPLQNIIIINMQSSKAGHVGFGKMSFLSYSCHLDRLLCPGRSTRRPRLLFRPVYPRPLRPPVRQSSCPGQYGAETEDTKNTHIITQ